MKKVLIVIHDMRIGGAQKSLASFLQCMDKSPMGQEYKISLMVIDPAGPFMKDIPESVNLIEPPRPLRWLGSSLNGNLILKHFSWKGLIGELGWLMAKKRKKFPKGLNLQQKLWHSWKKYIPAWQEAYDVAVSYIDGVPGYYVMDCVAAKKKMLWVHSAYEKLEYEPSFDRPYYEKADGVITISEVCRQSLVKAFPGQGDKLHILENITDADAVCQKAEIGESPEFSDFQGLKLLSVGRLNAQKGFDMAAAAADILKKQGLHFRWLVLGDGPEREALEHQTAHLGVEDCFCLLGSRENPYGYIKNCDILVQSSRMEGKSIVLDETKMLRKPAVVTNYSTVRDSVEHGKTGFIVDMTPQALAEGILKLHREPALRHQIESFLATAAKGDEQELEKYCNIML